MAQESGEAWHVAGFIAGKEPSGIFGSGNHRAWLRRIGDGRPTVDINIEMSCPINEAELILGAMIAGLNTQPLPAPPET